MVALMSRGLGELAVALAWWLMVLGADFVQRQSFALEPLLLGAPYACLMANVLLINGLPDAAADVAPSAPLASAARTVQL